MIKHFICFLIFIAVSSSDQAPPIMELLELMSVEKTNAFQSLNARLFSTRMPSFMQRCPGLPFSATPSKRVNVVVGPAYYLGRPAIKVVQTNAFQIYQNESGTAQPYSYVTVPWVNLYEGTIDIDIAAERNRFQNNLSRAFAGIAFRIQTNDTFDVVYLRMTNGLLNSPPPEPPRTNRAIQYISLPKWDFDTLRTQFPGKYEHGANIGEKRWNHLQVKIKNNTMKAFIDWNPIPVLEVSLLGTNSVGPIALWVGDSTDAYFSNLRIQC